MGGVIHVCQVFGEKTAMKSVLKSALIATKQQEGVQAVFQDFGETFVRKTVIYTTVN